MDNGKMISSLKVQLLMQMVQNIVENLILKVDTLKVFTLLLMGLNGLDHLNWIEWMAKGFLLINRRRNGKELWKTISVKR